MTPVITIDRDRCIGSGMCVLYAEATFEHDAEAKAVLLEPVGDDLEAIRTAIEACPTRALALTDEGT